ncbi:TPA: recombinase RecT [Raoultella ornithinolytica]
MSNMLIDIKASLDRELVPVQSLLPAHVSFERFTNAAAVAIANSDDLKVADGQSIINSLVACAKDGLVPDGREAALVIFKKKTANGDWVKVAQYMPMIDGVLKRARQSGEISVIATRVVYENDTFRVWLDDEGEHVLYEPSLGDRGPMRGAFAYAKMKSGELQYEWLNLDDIAKVRAASKNSDKGPWVDWFESMSRKSAAHRLCRRLPNNSEIMEMLERGTEMVWQKEKDITPTRQGIADAGRNEEQPEEQTGSFDLEVIAEEYRQQIEGAKIADDAKSIGSKIDAMKNELGANLHVELKNKAIARYHQINADEKIKDLINSLPKPGSDEAKAAFEDVQKKLEYLKPRLGEDLYQGYSTNLLDMKPEYVG